MKSATRSRDCEMMAIGRIYNVWLACLCYEEAQDSVDHETSKIHEVRKLERV